MLRVIIGGRSTSDWKKLGTGIFVSSLLDGVKSQIHWFSNDINSNKKIWKPQRHFHQRVLHREEKELSILPIWLTDTKRDKHVNLLYVQNDDDVGHFAWIKNLSRLVSSQLSDMDTIWNMDTRNSFAIGTYTLSKNYKIFYNSSRD